MKQELNMDSYHDARAEIVRFHDMIAAWLRGDDAGLTREQVFDRFPAEFKVFPPGKPMLTTADLSGAWADSVRGSKPSLKISLDQFMPIYQDDQVAVLHYTETQTADDSRRVHRAVAILRRVAQTGQMEWVLQHESVL
jgi:hypothetical protein